MKSEELQMLTASEPLTLEEEYDMERSWRIDENKCTFLVLDLDTYQLSAQDEINSMVGDVNLFFHDLDSPHTAEVEIMIAEPWARGQGRGKEALYSMMRYGIEELGVTQYTAKIGLSNEASLRMFTNMAFTEVSRSDVFQEATLELPITKQRLEEIRSRTPVYRTEERNS